MMFGGRRGFVSRCQEKEKEGRCVGVFGLLVFDLGCDATRAECNAKLGG